MRSKEAIGLAILALVIVVLGVAGCGVRNGLVAAEEEVKSAWGNVESAYQRRADLIPNLVRAVERAEVLDRELVASLESAQSRVSAAGSPGTGSPDRARLAEYGSAQRELEVSLDRLLETVSGSDALRSVEAFRDLQDQIEGSENRINFARRDYNDAVRRYNARVRRFPTSVVAALTGFDTQPPFEADEGADEPPVVK